MATHGPDIAHHAFPPDEALQGTLHHGASQRGERVAHDHQPGDDQDDDEDVAVCLELAEQAVAAAPEDEEARRLRAWIAEIQGLATLFDRALRALSRAETGEIQAGFAVLSKVSDQTLDNLLRLFGSLPEDELAETLESLSRTSPTTARRVLKAANRIARFGR